MFILFTLTLESSKRERELFSEENYSQKEKVITLNWIILIPREKSWQDWVGHFMSWSGRCNNYYQPLFINLSNIPLNLYCWGETEISKINLDFKSTWCENIQRSSILVRLRWNNNLRSTSVDNNEATLYGIDNVNNDSRNSHLKVQLIF